MCLVAANMYWMGGGVLMFMFSSGLVVRVGYTSAGGHRCKGQPLYMNTNIAAVWDRSGDLQITRKAS